MKQLLLPIVGVALFIIIVGILTKSVQEKGTLPFDVNQTTTSPKEEVIIRDVGFSIEIADTEEARLVGLSNRESMPEDEGMFFVFDEKAVFPSFWMKDTHIPLDIIWIRDGQILKIDKDVQPEPRKAQEELTIYKPPKLVDYVLEINAGISEKHGFEEGDEVILPAGY